MLVSQLPSALKTPNRFCFRSSPSPLIKQSEIPVHVLVIGPLLVPAIFLSILLLSILLKFPIHNLPTRNHPTSRTRDLGEDVLDVLALERLGEQRGPDGLDVLDSRGFEQDL
ncbi:hypothetical protein HBH79_116950 [Parastagonospora nodorum]|nr:hypothetical protein HBI01_044410 [Parastagonospora nodorum]KAH4314360.1 hypothetical protein HBI02_071890 [Parastagonospora nodorum]KAH4333966.1 hypothetical protein HBI00_042580 [Parastagonospora nodorum]KAH4408068.1 hypothetical protein HBH92_152200 [Parastagonospora nodorum]KAH4441980.1 hypothetical protein HBH93_076210 [Parastagonospora nodorum]